MITVFFQECIGFTRPGNLNFSCIRARRDGGTATRGEARDRNFLA
jgi:hypothetical protein